MKLWELFKELDLPTGTSEFLAERISGWHNYRVAKDQSGRPALLIAQAGDFSADLQPQSELKHVSFWPTAFCEITTAIGRDSGLFAIVRWKNDDRTLQELFLDVLGNWIETLGQHPNAQVIRSGFVRLAQLFETLAEPRSTDVIGLWGELLVLACCSSPELLVRAWHVDIHELYDFQAGKSLVEVKTTTEKIRRHDFSLQQLSPPTGTRLVIVSVLLEETGDTISVAELAEIVKSQIDMPELRLRVDEVIAATLGQAWSELSRRRFNPITAALSLRFFSEEFIPCVERDVPVEVSDVRFKVDLDGVPPTNEAALVAFSPLHAALRPAPGTRARRRWWE
jgi:hypothetical protein